MLSAIVLDERSRGTSSASIERRWGVIGLEGTEESWRDTALWLLSGHAAVFERIAWSTATVFAETCERAREAGIDVVELPLWYDVDDGATLKILETELLAGIAPGFAVEFEFPF